MSCPDHPRGEIGCATCFNALEQERDTLKARLEEAENVRDEYHDGCTSKALKLERERDLLAKGVDDAKHIVDQARRDRDLARAGEKAWKQEAEVNRQGYLQEMRRAEAAEKDLALAKEWAEGEESNVKLYREKVFAAEQKVAEMNSEIEAIGRPTGWPEKIAELQKTIVSLERHLREACPCVDCDEARATLREVKE